MKVFYVTFIISVLLIIAGFFSPPLGVIDGSVLTAVGLLLLFAVIEKLPQAIKEGRNIKFQKGDIALDISSEKSKHSI